MTEKSQKRRRAGDDAEEAERIEIDPDAEAPEELVTGGDAVLEEEVAGEGAPRELQVVEFDIRHDLQKRVDLYLRDRLPDYSRAMLQKVVKSGAVLVNGRVAKSSTELRSGDQVKVTLPKAAPREALPENIPLEVVYEDEQFIALNKQSGLIVHPARGHWTGTLINALLFHAQQTHSTLSTGSDPWRPGIIHRLDRDTTGLILIAKTDEAHWRLAGQFERRTIKKTYLAIVHGLVELESDLIDAPLAVNPKIREKYAVRPDVGKPAQTVYTVKERFKIGRAGYTLLELAPKTGRTHQLRVHCAYIGHPIVGDSMYGGRQITLADIDPAAGQARNAKTSAKNGQPAGNAGIATSDQVLITRQALHAFRLQFVHPTKFTRMVLEAKTPPDIEHILDLLRIHGEPVKKKARA
jgi:23S rRNA pseudouridine1911/1915/1917 synthase